MDDRPFENLLGLVVQAQSELIPAPMRLAIEALEANDVRYPTDEERMPLLSSIRSMRTEEEFRSWLHLEAEIVDMVELHHSLDAMTRYLLSAPADDPAALRAMREIVPCPTWSNLCRIAVRDFLP